MTDTLLSWISSFRAEIENFGFQLEWKSGYDGSSSVKIDNKHVVGSIVFWPENRFEFEFLSRESGVQIFFVEREIFNMSELRDFFLSIQSKLTA
jgi:hypothetical protein